MGYFFFCIGLTMISSLGRIQILFNNIITAYKDISTP